MSVRHSLFVRFWFGGSLFTALVERILLCPVTATAGFAAGLLEFIPTLLGVFA